MDLSRRKFLGFAAAAAVTPLVPAASRPTELPVLSPAEVSQALEPLLQTARATPLAFTGVNSIGGLSVISFDAVVGPPATVEPIDDEDDWS